MSNSKEELKKRAVYFKEFVVAFGKSFLGEEETKLIKDSFDKTSQQVLEGCFMAFVDSLDKELSMMTKVIRSAVELISSNEFNDLMEWMQKKTTKEEENNNDCQA